MNKQFWIQFFSCSVFVHTLAMVEQIFAVFVLNNNNNHGTNSGSNKNVRTHSKPTTIKINIFIFGNGFSSQVTWTENLAFILRYFCGIRTIRTYIKQRGIFRLHYMIRTDDSQTASTFYPSQLTMLRLVHHVFAYTGTHMWHSIIVENEIQNRTNSIIRIFVFLFLVEPLSTHAVNKMECSTHAYR